MINVRKTYLKIINSTVPTRLQVSSWIGLTVYSKNILDPKVISSNSQIVQRNFGLVGEITSKRILSFFLSLMGN